MNRAIEVDEKESTNKVFSGPIKRKRKRKKVKYATDVERKLEHAERNKRLRLRLKNEREALCLRLVELRLEKERIVNLNQRMLLSVSNLRDYSDSSFKYWSRDINKVDCQYTSTNIYFGLQYSDLILEEHETASNGLNQNNKIQEDERNKVAHQVCFNILAQGTQDIYIDSLLTMKIQLKCSQYKTIILETCGFTHTILPVPIPEQPYYSNEIISICCHKMYKDLPLDCILRGIKTFATGSAPESTRNFTDGKTFNTPFSSKINVMNRDSSVILLEPLTTKGRLFDYFPHKGLITKLLYTEEIKLMTEYEVDLICDGRYNEYIGRKSDTILGHDRIVTVYCLGSQMIRSEDGVTWRRAHIPYVAGYCVVPFPNRSVFCTLFLSGTCVSFAVAGEKLIGKELCPNITPMEFESVLETCSRAVLNHADSIVKKLH